MPEKRLRKEPAARQKSRKKLETMLMTPCRTIKQFSNWVQYFLGLHLPDCVVSRYADTTPLGVAWEVYRICVLRENPENIQELLYVASRGSGKCVSKGTLILTSAGLKKIENVQVGDVVYTGWNWQKVKNTFDEGIKNGVELRTQLLSKDAPQTLSGSLKHRIQVVKSDGEIGWEYLPNLKVGQYVYKVSNVALCDADLIKTGPQFKSGWLIGALLGDGCISRHGNNIAFCSSDFKCLRHYSQWIFNKFGIKCTVKRNSSKSVVLSITDTTFRSWVNSYICGTSSYEKKLKTLEHSHDFLAGICSGLMDTDGSKDGIVLANKDLIDQIGVILTNFGVACSINNNRRLPQYSQFIKRDVTYHECMFKGKLPDAILPLFSKRKEFIRHRAKMNEQFRYPNQLVQPFAKYIKNELHGKNGWLTINGKRIRKSVPHSNALYGALFKNQKHIHKHKLIDLRNFFKELGLHDQVDKLNFVIDGYYEKIVSIRPVQAYFYDLEVDNTHSYWSNGFISHNTLGMAIAELMVILHDRRDTVHVGAILGQAKRCYEYIVKFLLNQKLSSVLNPPSLKLDKRILQKMNMEKSVFKLGEEQVTLEILPCTLKACLDPFSIVNTQRGPLLLEEVSKGDFIESIDYKTLRRRLTLVYDNQSTYQDSIAIELDNGIRFIGSNKHEVLTRNGWTALQDVNLNTQLMYYPTQHQGYSQYQHRFPKITADYAKSALIGMMLGDGSLSIPKTGGNPRFYLAHSTKQQDYLYHCKDVIEHLVKVRQVRQKITGYKSHALELITESTDKLNFLKYLFYDGKKSIKSILYSYFDEIALAYWFMDDGSADANATFATCSFSQDECQILIEILSEKFNLKSARILTTALNHNLIKLNTDDTKKLYNLIIRHIPASMQYKFNKVSVKNVKRLTDGKMCKFSKNGLPKEERDTRAYRQWLKYFQNNTEYQWVGIKSKYFIGKQRVMQIEVEGNNYTEHSYFANGVLHANCNGPHCPLVVLDELDTISGEGIRAFDDIAGMLDSRGSQKALRVGISTRKTLYGLMNQQMENAIQENRTIRRWTAFEFTERCPDEKSGTEPLDLYIRQESLEALTKDQWALKDPQRQKEYEKHKMYTGCGKCPLAAICLGDAKKQKSKSFMLKTLKELEQKVLTNGADWSLSQLMNLKPSMEGIIYKEFDRRDHVKTWNEMWKKLTGKEFPGECTHDMFVKKCFSDDTEVLTQNGFKLFRDLTAYDTIASLDDCGTLIYEQPLDYISYQYDGIAYNLYNQIGGHGKQLDLMMTKDHNQVYVDRHDLRKDRIVYKKRSIQELAGKEFYVPAVPLSSVFGAGYSPISFMTPDDYAAFMGLWLSEGSCASIRAKRVYRQNSVSVCQLKKQNIAKIDRLMNSIRWPSKLTRSVDVRDGCVSWTIFNKELYDHVSRWRYAVNKSISRSFFDEATEQQYRIMLQWLLLGDGAEYDDNSVQQPYYGTGSQKLANDVQELAFRLGYRTNLTDKYKRDKRYGVGGTEYLPMHRVQIHTKNADRVGSKYWYINNGANKSEFADKRLNNIDKCTYKGTVYCVTMPSGRLFVRRNGVIALSGNCHEMALPCYAGVDWGWSNPSTVVFFFIDTRENVYVVRCDGETFCNDPKWINKIKTKYHRMYRCQLYFPDIANGSAIDLMKQGGLPVANKIDKSINLGIQVIKRLLRTPGSGEPKILFAHETCSQIVDEMERYHFKINTAGEVTDDPEQEFDHWLDALRYALTMLLGKAMMLMMASGDALDGNITDKNGSFYNIPTAAEFAAAHGIQFNENLTEREKIGKIGTLSDLDDDDDDNDGTGGDGSFLWSF
jgi:hypothetical protein